MYVTRNSGPARGHRGGFTGPFFSRFDGGRPLCLLEIIVSTRDILVAFRLRVQCSFNISTFKRSGARSAMRVLGPGSRTRGTGCWRLRFPYYRKAKSSIIHIRGLPSQAPRRWHPETADVRGFCSTMASIYLSSTVERIGDP